MTKSMPVLTTPTSAKLSALNAVRFRCGAGVIGFGGNGGGKGFDMMDGGLAWQTPRRAPQRHKLSSAGLARRHQLGCRARTRSRPIDDSRDGKNRCHDDSNEQPSPRAPGRAVPGRVGGRRSVDHCAGVQRAPAISSPCTSVSSASAPRCGKTVDCACEIIYVDDGSRDDTLAVARALVSPVSMCR